MCGKCITEVYILKHIHHIWKKKEKWSVKLEVGPWWRYVTSKWLLCSPISGWCRPSTGTLTVRRSSLFLWDSERRSRISKGCTCKDEEREALAQKHSMVYWTSSCDLALTHCACVIPPLYAWEHNTGLPTFMMTTPTNYMCTAVVISYWHAIYGQII